MSTSGGAPASGAPSWLAATDGHGPKVIMVTGGCGFIGSRVVVRLVDAGYRVVVFDSLEYCGSMRNLDGVVSRIRFVRGSVCDVEFVRYVLENERVDAVLHFAASTHVDLSFGNSLPFSEHNVVGTHALLEAVREYGKIGRFVHVSTDEVYGSSDTRTHREEDVLTPTNPYAATKAAAEQIVKSYHASFGVPVIVTRGNNVYGPGQFPEKIVPKFVRRLAQQPPLPCCLHGDGRNSRHYVYVDDVAEAFDVILHKGVIGETYNIGTDDEHSNLAVAERLVAIMHPHRDARELIEYVRDRAFNDVRYVIDSSKLRALGWRPRTSFERGLRATVAFYTSVPSDWWTCGTDASLAPHPGPQPKQSTEPRDAAA